MPYLEGDELLFESSFGGKEEIIVSEIVSYINADDPLAFFPDKYQTLFVTGSLKNLIEHNNKNDIANLLMITTGRKGDIYKFNFSKTNTNFKYPTTALTRNELDLFFDNVDRTVITAKDESLPFKFDVLNFTWDIKLGYVEYSLRNGEVWKLKSFIRNGRDIMN